MKPRLENYLKKKKALVDETLDRLLPPASRTPRILHESMRYSIFSGGKRLRPILCMAAAEVCGQSARRVLPTACAIELIHTYSLIHDDLPAMDNDDYRRGRLTNHKKFGEGLAILTGDALLTLAFDLIVQNRSPKGVSAQAITDVIQSVASGAGTMGMIGGQVADIFSDRGKWKSASQRFEHLTPTTLLKKIHAWKTAALITTSLLAGGRLSNASLIQMKALRSFGYSLGMAFQVKDDLLDVTGDKKKLGKRGSDGDNQKLTYPALLGIRRSEQILSRFIIQAHQALKVFGDRALILHDLADFVRHRDH